MTDEIAERLKKFILTEEEKGSVEIALQDIMSSMEHCEVVQKPGRENNNMISKVDNILVDKKLEVNELVNKSLQQIATREEPMFADTIGDNYVNDKFIRDVMNDEIRPEVFDMHPLKAPSVNECDPLNRGGRVVDRPSLCPIGDASLQKEKKMANIGVTAIDSYEILLQTFGNSIQFGEKTLTAEALAIREALKNAMRNGWSRVQILSYAKSMVDMILKQNDVSWEIEATCEDIWTLMRSFDEINFVHISRSWNMLAHNLANFSISLLHKTV
ncbi:hypothetical protein HAX54_052632 [Datura stramonium]|uniref:RNase H type-1 domain-containing protein n=1 Tax=Datura stramonium TaxID=4076 RepID=A0ABS8RRR4_DATST|nr:hypothetical protein [Datura stramonium]